MCKKLLLALLPLLAVSCEKPSPPSTPARSVGEVQTVDPREVLYSLPTLCEAVPPTAAGKPFEGHKSLHEDDWRQVEFVPVANRDYLQTKLAEYTAFREQHRKGAAFTEVFMRPEHPVPLAPAGLSTRELPRLSELPLALRGGSESGMVTGGFSLSDGGDWYLYGQLSLEGIVTSLGVSPGHGTVPTEAFVRALIQLAGTRMLLVDWYLGAIVDTSSPETVLAWASRFK